jgi:hypothetical protein
MVPTRMMIHAGAVGFTQITATDEVVFGARTPRPAVFSKIISRHSLCWFWSCI